MSNKTYAITDGQLGALKDVHKGLLEMYHAHGSTYSQPGLIQATLDKGREALSEIMEVTGSEWTTNKGSVPDGMGESLVDVEFRNGERVFGYCVKIWDWRILRSAGDIIRWRLAK